MTNKRIIYLLLAAFIAGNLLLIYIQYNSSKNINILVDSNEKVLAEMDVSNNLRELNRDIAFFEGRTFNSTDTFRPEEITKQISKVQSIIDSLQKISDDDSSVKYIDVLDPLVREKLLLGRQSAGAVHIHGQRDAQTKRTLSRASQLTDSIRIVTRLIEKSRDRLIAKVTAEIDKSGKKALNSGTILIILALISGAVLFWIIIIIIQQQSQLIQKLNISEKKNKEVALIKETFLANTSHEIRTPMNAILGFTNLLQRKNLDEESKEYVQTIQNACEKLLAIINDILDLSKIEAGMMRIESSAFSVRGLLHSIETMFKLKSVEKKVLLSVEVDDTVPDILEGDPTRLTQILVNLIENSLKFTRKGSITIKISNEGSKNDFIDTSITVTDTGIGIEKDKLQFIFERFQQVEDSIIRKIGGTGLGLSIVRDLVHLQNGSIHVESVPGHGTTFKIIIPYKISTEKLPGRSSSGIDAVPESNFERILVLVVEDNEINQSLIKHLFRRWRLKYDLANNGSEAIEKLTHSKYDLILMDIQMPEMDGYTASQHIRENLKLNTPIVAMTAHALAGEKERCLSYGMDEYIAKPLREEILHNLITQFVEVSQPAVSENASTNKITGTSYHYINLDYMKEVSCGNIEYEKTVTDQFTEAVPRDLLLLENAWRDNHISEVRQLAHNMKTTVSVMGLNELLQPYLDAMEYEELTEETFTSKFTSLKSICNASIEEANFFYATL